MDIQKIDTENISVAEERKKDHIDLAFKSQIDKSFVDIRFNYESAIYAHPESLKPFQFLNKTFGAPWWISSMTGGTKQATSINKNLALLAKKYRLGMGLGSCRIILQDDTYLADFQVRKYLGDDQPLYANLGIAQLEILLENKKHGILNDLVHRTEADGLIIHINPLQEWLQPTGDRYYKSPIESISSLLEKAKFPIIVKEVGQGFGPESIKALLQLPIAALEFGAFGGTNFSQLELLRSDPASTESFKPLANIGHSASQMVHFVNDAIKDLGDNIKCKEFIVSGGIKSFLDGYYELEMINGNAIIGQASTLLKYAAESFELCDQYMNNQIQGYTFAQQFLKLKK